MRLSCGHVNSGDPSGSELGPSPQIYQCFVLRSSMAISNDSFTLSLCRKYLTSSQHTFAADSTLMESPLFNLIFRQLCALPAKNCLRQQRQRTNLLQLSTPQPRRNYASRRKRERSDGSTSDWQQRLDAFPKDMSKQLQEYPLVTANDLRSRMHRPRRVKMLTRDFIDGQTLYSNVRKAVILTISRQSIQPSLWILLQARDHLQSGRTLRFQPLSK